MCLLGGVVWLLKMVIERVFHNVAGAINFVLGLPLSTACLAPDCWNLKWTDLICW